MKEKRIYLDYNATTPVSAEANAAIMDGLSLYGNASSMHEDGRRARFEIEQAGRNVAALVGADESSSRQNRTVPSLSLVSQISDG
jgi:cysteine desulfurase